MLNLLWHLLHWLYVGLWWIEVVHVVEVHVTFLKKKKTRKKSVNLSIFRLKLSKRLNWIKHYLALDSWFINSVKILYIICFEC